MAKPSGREVTWSPQGWLLSQPGARVESDNQKLTFAQISFAVMDTMKQAQVICEQVTDALEKQKFLQQISQLKSAAAQYVSAGQMYNSNPTRENDKILQDTDAVLGHVHGNILKLMVHHSENQFTVDPAKQRQYLLKELESALSDVNEWRGQAEMMQIDADAFYKAADRLLRAQVSVIKNIIQGRDKQVEIAQQVKAWGTDAVEYRDVFLPRAAKKWEQVDVYALEDKLFALLENIQRSIHSAI